ncbi:MAG: hypothetical protein HQ492_10120 [Woeseiaceae bacterium]|nr:hypothetical protein [Woeseiaceae bacterium]
MNRREFTKASLATVSLTALGSSLADREQLIRKAIPSSGEMVPVIGLGTNRYGVDTSEAARATASSAASIPRIGRHRN